MKCTTIIDPAREEEVLIYAHQKTARTDEIEAFVTSGDTALFGYRGNEILKLSLSAVFCFAVRDGKVFAVTESGEWLMHERLYMLEEKVGGNFLKINQSCLANMKRIKKFDVTFGGALAVIFGNGYRDYVSRRRLTAVKERMGIK